MSELERFRTEIRTWLEQNAPAVVRGRPPMMMEVAGEEESAELREGRKRWLQVMAERGLTAPMWPKEYGGGGLSPQQNKVLMEEMALLKVSPPLFGMGLSMIGPTLLVHGTEEQKQRFIPKIISGEHRWCQGFSEPGAGSDLASLRAAAKVDADGNFIINGQKTWTSGGQFANWIFMLTRTDETTPR